MRSLWAASSALARHDAVMTGDEFAQMFDSAVVALGQLVDADWTERAGTLDWTCWETVDHMIDCVFSYAMQVGAGAEQGFLPFTELHAQPDATPADLVAGLRGVGAMFLGVVRGSRRDAKASDGVLALGLPQWSARAAYEICLHTFDVATGLGVAFEPPGELAKSILGSEGLWMLDRNRAGTAVDPWAGLLLGSGRSVGV